jgi:hypothetical protein
VSPKPEDPTQPIYEMHIIVKGLGFWLLLLGWVSWFFVGFFHRWLGVVEKRFCDCNLYTVLGKRVDRAL